MDDERISYHRYVPIDRIDDFLRVGWVSDGLGPLPTPHGVYAIMMDWPTSGKPVEPDLGPREADAMSEVEA